ncbi:MAG: hypothetical protein LBB24_02410 [Rickettsiales bacterium]|jgi:hypothetical protein|nr:hypothetical protein [Rickettsiales bacterium]
MEIKTEKSKSLRNESELAKVVEAKQINELAPDEVRTIPDRVFNFGSEQNAQKREGLQKGFVEQLSAEQLDAMAVQRGDGTFLSARQKICAIKANYIRIEVLRQLKPTTVKLFTPEQIGSLSVEQLGALTSDQVRALTKEHIKVLVDENLLQYLSDNILASATEVALTEEQIKTLIEAKKIKFLPVKFVCYSVLDAEILSGLDEGQRNSFFDQLSGDQLDEMVSSNEASGEGIDMNLIPAEVFKTLSEKAIRSLTGGRLRSLNTEHVGAMTDKQLNVVASNNVSGGLFSAGHSGIQDIEINSVSQMVFLGLSPNTISKLSLEQIGGLDEKLLGVLTPDQAKGLTKSQVSALVSGGRLHFLSDEAIAALVVKVNLRNLTDEGLNYLVETGKIKRLSPEALDTLEKTQPARLSNANLERLEGLEGGHILTRDICDTLIKGARLHYLSGEVLEKLDDKINLESASIFSFNGASRENSICKQLEELIKYRKVRYLSCAANSSIGTSYIEVLDATARQNYIGQLTREQLDDMARHGKISVIDNPNSIDVEVFRNLSPDTIAAFSKEQLGGLDEEHTGAMTVAQVAEINVKKVTSIKLDLLDNETLRSMSREGKIKNLTVQQLLNLAKVKKLGQLSNSVEVMLVALRNAKNNNDMSIDDADAIRSMAMDTEFVHDGSSKINLNREEEEEINNVAAEYARFVSNDITDIKTEINNDLENEKYEYIVPCAVNLIGKNEEQRKTVETAVQNRIDSCTGDVYGLIDKINLSIVKITLDDSESKTTKDYEELKKIVESLILRANHDSLDKYFSTMDTVLSLIDKMDMNDDYRLILLEEIIKMSDDFKLKYYSTLENNVLHTFARQKLTDIYVKYAETLLEKYEVDPGELIKKLNANNSFSEGGDPTRGLNDDERKILKVLLDIENISLEEDGGLAALGPVITPWIRLVKNAAALYGAARLTRAATGSKAAQVVVGAVGVAVVAKGAKNAAELTSFMMMNEENRKKHHLRERKKSKEQRSKPLYRVVDVFFRPIAVFAFRSRKQLYKFFERIVFGGENDSKRGFDRDEYHSPDKKNNKKDCLDFKKGCVKKAKSDIKSTEKKAYLHALEIVNGVLSSKNKEKGNTTGQDMESDRVRKLNDDSHKFEEEALELWLAKKRMELGKEYPGFVIPGDKKTFFGTIFKAAGDIVSGIIGGLSPFCLRLIDETVHGTPSKEEKGADGIAKVKIIEKLKEIGDEFNACQIKLAEKRAKMSAGVNDHARKKFEEINNVHTEALARAENVLDKVLENNGSGVKKTAKSKKKNNAVVRDKTGKKAEKVKNVPEASLEFSENNTGTKKLLDDNNDLNGLSSKLHGATGRMNEGLSNSTHVFSSSQGSGK